MGRTEYEAWQRALETERLLHKHSRAPWTDRHTVCRSDVGKSSPLICVDGVPQVLRRLELRILLPADITPGVSIRYFAESLPLSVTAISWQM